MTQSRTKNCAYSGPPFPILPSSDAPYVLYGGGGMDRPNKCTINPTGTQPNAATIVYLHEESECERKQYVKKAKKIKIKNK